MRLAALIYDCPHASSTEIRMSAHLEGKLFAKWPRLLLFSAVYLVVGFLFVATPYRSPVGQALWPYTGLGLAGALLFGPRIWPLLLLLNFVLQLENNSAGIAGAEAVAETLGVITSSWLLQRLRFNTLLQRLRDAVVLILVGCGVGCFPGAGLKHLLLYLMGEDSWNQALYGWWSWWRGDALGVLIFTPLLLAWMAPHAADEESRPHRRLEAIVLLAFAVLLCALILTGAGGETSMHNPLFDVFFLIAFWGAMRFGVRGAVTLSALAAFFAVIDALTHMGNASMAAVAWSFLELWAFLAVLSSSSLIMASAIGEHAKVNNRNRQLAAILQATPDFVGIARPNGKILFLNRAAKTLLGKKALGQERTLSEFHSPEILHRVVTEVIPTAMSTGRWSGESVLLHHGTEEIPVSQVVMAHRSPRGEVEFLSTISRDLSDRKRVENTLRQAAVGVSEGGGGGFFDSLVRRLAQNLQLKYVFIGAPKVAAPEVIETLALCANGELRPNFQYSLLGTPCASVLGKRVCHFKSGVARLFPDDVLLTQMGVDAYMGVPLFSSSGESIGLLVGLNDKPIEDAETATSIFKIYATRAATELERLRAEQSLRFAEDKFRQVQKMQALGTLASGIAHDFNNLLTVIKGCGMLAMESMSSANPAWEDLQEVQKAADRAAALTSHLLAFTRQQPIHAKTVNVNEAIRGVGKMLGRVLGEDVHLEMGLSTQTEWVRIDPGQFDQVLMNFAVNARDAMPTGGTLRFVTRKTTLKAEDAKSRSLPAGEYVLLEISDTGMGMDKATQERIFEPFFTTKPVGKGTGLGLSTVYGIMEQLGGGVAVDSELGKGTTFQLYFPATQSANDERLPQRANSKSSGHETLLLVEDDVSLRHLAEKILHATGYTILSASNTEDAARVLLEFSGRVHLVITDVVMPGGGGQELVERLARTRPDTKVLFMSGYADGKVPARYLSGELGSFLAKPFEPAQLTAKVRELLDSEVSIAASKS